MDKNSFTEDKSGDSSDGTGFGGATFVDLLMAAGTLAIVVCFGIGVSFASSHANRQHYINATSTACAGNGFPKETVYRDGLAPVAKATDSTGGRDFSVVVYRSETGAGVCAFTVKEEHFTGAGFFKNTFAAGRYSEESIGITCRPEESNPPVVDSVPEVTDQGSYVHLAGPVVLESEGPVLCVGTYDGREITVNVPAE